MSRRLPLRAVLIASMVAVTAFAILGLSAQRYVWLTGALQQEQLDQDLELARSVAFGIDRYVIHQRHLVDQLAAEVAVLGLRNPAALTDLLETANHREPAFGTLFVTDPAGVAVAFSPPVDEDGKPTLGRHYGDRAWFQDALRGAARPSSYEVVIGRVVRRPTVAIAAPVRGPGGLVIGVVGGALSLEHLRASVRDVGQFSRDRVVLVDARGHVIAHSSAEWEAGAHDLSHEAVFGAAQRQDSGTIEFRSEFSGTDRLAAFVHVPSTGWAIWTTRGPEVRAAKVRSLIGDIVLWGLAGFLVATLVAMVLSHALARPLTLLSEATRQVTARGVADPSLLPRHHSRIREFSDLETGFRQMAEGLRAHQTDLEAKVAERTQALAEAAREAKAAATRLAAREAIERGYGELAALLNSLDRSYILDEGVKKIAASLHAPLAAVYLTDDGPDSLHLKTYSAMDPAAVDSALLSAGGLPEQAAHRLEPVLVALPPGSDRIRLRTGVGELEIAAVAAFPLRHQDRLMGVLVVATLEPLTDDTRHFLENAARQLSVALNNAALFESVRYQSQRLEQLNLALGQASEAKSRFLSSMSHELRTPLNAIIGFTELLLMSGREPLSERQRTSLTKVRDGGHHLLGLINGVLDLSKIEAGRTEVQPEPFTVPLLVSECLAAVEPQAQAKGLALRAVGANTVAELVQDRAKVKQVLVNLLANAVKFTPTGSVEIRIAPGPDDTVCLAVADTGMGIAPEDQVAIFEEFRQAGPQGNGGTQGTGLGLAISRRLAALLGGGLTVDSAPGQGSVFTFRLPVRFTPPAAQPSAGEPSTPADLPPGVTRILVVDDDQNAVELIRQALADEPFHVDWASNASEALSRAMSLRPNAILLDVILQGAEDGWQILRMLKADPLVRDIPVVLHSVIDNPERARQLGAAAVLVKPAAAGVITALLRRHSTPITPRRGAVVDAA